MNIDAIFNKFPKKRRETKIQLKDSIVTVVRGEGVVQILYGEENTSPLFRIVVYGKSRGNDILCYSYDRPDIRLMDKEDFIDHIRNYHPEFFEWMIWNLP
jgi:hypothetical protein